MAGRERPTRLAFDTVVEFPRPVDNCTATATYGGDPNDDVFAEVQYDANPARLTVWLEDETGAFVSGAGMIFHMIVICPCR